MSDLERSYERKLDALRQEREGALNEQRRLRDYSDVLFERATTAEAERDRYREALAALVAKLDVVHADDRYQRVWIAARNVDHDDYRGPTYATELDAARAALRPVDTPEGQQ